MVMVCAFKQGFIFVKSMQIEKFKFWCNTSPPLKVENKGNVPRKQKEGLSSSLSSNCINIPSVTDLPERVICVISFVTIIQLLNLVDMMSLVDLSCVTGL